MSSTSGTHQGHVAPEKVTSAVLKLMGTRPTNPASPSARAPVPSPVATKATGGIPGVSADATK